MKTLVNFRDAGGCKTISGKEVKRGKIYRSGEIINLSPEDKNAFKETYGIKTIFDLRGALELAERPDDQFTGVDYVNLDIMKDSAGHSASLEDLGAEPVSADNHMKRIYKDMILTDSGQQGYRQFLEKIAQDDNPFIFHCFAGKDRTGIAAALVLGLLDVDKEAIYIDYLLTNKMRQAANLIIVEDYRQKGMNEAELKEIETMMFVKADYLDVAYQTMTDYYGGLAGYVKDGLGLSASLITDLKKLYTI